MEAPNKIYVPILPRTENSIISEHCVGTAWKNKEHITIPDIEEYIRKDALLEWAKAEIELSKEVECVSEKSYEEGRQQVAQNLIDKINAI